MLLDITPARRQSISITPLIDVIFILLFFFMLTSTFSKTKQIAINTASAGALQQELKAHKILLLSNAQVQVDGQLYARDGAELLSVLQSFAVGDEPVTAAASKQLSVQSLLRFIDLASGLGISRLRLSESVAP